MYSIATKQAEVKSAMLSSASQLLAYSLRSGTIGKHTGYHEGSTLRPNHCRLTSIHLHLRSYPPSPDYRSCSTLFFDTHCSFYTLNHESTAARWFDLYETNTKQSRVRIPSKSFLASFFRRRRMGKQVEKRTHIYPRAVQWYGRDSVHRVAFSFGFLKVRVWMN